ncbi:MAG: VIT and VWA domain-containing protein [Pseudomonadota bacterium]
MKLLKLLIGGLVTLVFVLGGMQQARAAGLLQPLNSSRPALELSEHHVSVTIEDGYAITSVEQVFTNPNPQDLEAIYSFPVPARAAVGEFTFWIDGQPVSGEVFEKAQARSIYEEERRAGRDAALAEQDDYRSFDIAVSPVRAGQDARVRLVYLQPVHADTAIGRYVYPLEDGGVDEQRLAFWSYDDVVRERFSFELRFRSSWPVEEFRLPRHPQALIERISDQEWRVSMASDTGDATVAEDGATAMQRLNGEHHGQPGELQGTRQAALAHRLDQDIVVYWRQAENLPAAVELVHFREDPSGMGTFMMTLTPGNELAPIVEGRDWLFVLDLSGSMSGKYRSLVEGVRRGLDRLQGGDRFRIVLFNDRAWALTPGWVPVDAASVQHYTQALEQVGPTSGTNLYAGLSLGLDDLDADRSSAVVQVTDGVANVGLTERKDFLDLLAAKDVRLFTFVMGNSANRPLLYGMARVSNGFAMNVSNSDDIAGKLLEATSKLTHEAMHDVSVEFDGVRVGDLAPETIGSLYRGQQLILFGHYWGAGEADLTIRGKVSGRPVTWTTRVAFPETAMANPELERLWAFALIDDLQAELDYFGSASELAPDLEEAIVDVAVEYGLVTQHTSMLVLTEERFAELGIERRNRDRLVREALARQDRASQGVRHHRVDGEQPISSRPRASHGNGGGALNPWMLVLLALLLWRPLSARFGNVGVERA